MHGVPPMMQHCAILNHVLDLCNAFYATLNVVVFIPCRVPSSQPKPINMNRASFARPKHARRAFVSPQSHSLFLSYVFFSQRNVTGYFCLCHKGM